MTASLLNVETLEERLSRPSASDLDFMRRIEGDILVLGASGKMGPSLARLAGRATQMAGRARRIIAVSRSGAIDSGGDLERCGVESIACDLLDRDQLARLPGAPNVIFLAGRKFGSKENQALTWATNVLLPALAAERFAGARIVALSSGNVYPLSEFPVSESMAPSPVGEYAQSVLGRERVFEYYAGRDGTRVALIRLNYAIDLRYGVLLDIGRRVWEGRPVNLEMGRVNVIWQRDANSMCLRALELAASPAVALNVTGSETTEVRWIAERFGEAFGREPVFEGTPARTALLSDASLACRLLGRPEVGVGEMIAMIGQWIRDGLPTLDKPTHFEVRDGRF